jgi:GH24 family phage-related lysozyme (muramidase)
MYLDSEQVPTIGIGFNLTKKGAKERIENLGYDYNKVLSGEQAITTTDINSLFVEDVAIAIDEAKSIFNKGDYDFNSLPNNVASVVTKMLFQLGIKRFKGFTSFIQAVKDGDYDKASKEILTTTKKDGTVVKSKFHKQVPKRANRLAQQIKGK